MSLTVPKEYTDFLYENFGHKEFRPKQWEAIQSILHEKCDNFVIAAAGYGKSLIYQFPALYKNKIALVVAPTISLMQSQLLKENIRNRACIFGPTEPDNTEDIENMKYNIVYTTPERIRCESGLELVRSLRNELILIAIDEAQCISTWGGDYFRQTFQGLSQLRSVVPEIPIVALTASVTETIREDICQVLNLQSPKVRKSGIDRPNLEYILKPKPTIENFWNFVLPYVRKAFVEDKGSIIIYFTTNKEVRTMATKFNHKFFSFYHNGLSEQDRSKNLKDFLENQKRIIVGTKALSMGIDKPDVRLVIHYGATAFSFYHSEIGRAGRDGEPAVSLLLHPSFAMDEYTNIATCRRKYILKCFEDEAAETLPIRRGCCDNCDISVSLLTIIDDFDGLYNVREIIGILHGYTHHSYKLSGIGHHKSQNWFGLMLNDLVTLEYIRIENDALHTTQLADNLLESERS